MSGDFLDTNIFVYTFDRRDQRKQAIARSLVQSAIEHNSGAISHQVVQETLNVLTSTKLPESLSPSQARRTLDDLLVPLWTVFPAPELYRRGLELQSRYQLGYYDALIVAAALEAGCDRLLSEDLQDGQQI